MARPLSWLVVAGLAGAALIGPGAGGVAAGGPSDDNLPNSGHTSSGGLTLEMSKNATMACDANNSVGSISGTFTFSGSGHVVIYLVPNNGSDASPVGNVENNEKTIDLTGKTSPLAFTLTITSPFTTSKGGVLAVFAMGDNGDLYNSKSNSLNCTETTTTTSSSSDSTTTTQDTTTSSVASSTTTQDTTTSSVASSTTTQDTTTSSVASTTTTQDTTTSSVASTTTTQDTTTSSVASTTSAQTTDPSGEVEGVVGTPRVTLPPTSTLDAATPTGSPDGLRIALLGLAVLLASILLLQPKGSRSRK
jgi:hypothetical protein